MLLSGEVSTPDCNQHVARSSLSRTEGGYSPTEKEVQIIGKKKLLGIFGPFFAKPYLGWFIPNVVMICTKFF